MNDFKWLKKATDLLFCDQSMLKYITVLGSAWVCRRIDVSIVIPDDNTASPFGIIATDFRIAFQRAISNVSEFETTGRNPEGFPARFADHIFSVASHGRM